MKRSRPLSTLGVAGLVAFAALAAADPPTAAHESTAGDPPSMEELGAATYLGTDAGPVTLAEGEWRGEPFVAGGAAAPAVGLVREFRRTGDLTGDGADEAVVMLWSSSGGSGTYGYVAVMGRDGRGEPVNLGTARLGDRVDVRAAEVTDGRIILDVVQAGPGDAACCPGHKARRTFVLEGDALHEISTEDTGRLSIADLAGVEWLLSHVDRDEPVPEGVEVTLVFDGDRISGTSGCNRYFGNVVEGRTAGELAVSGPLAGTRMACPPPREEIESRYLAALQSVTKYSFIAGRLALTWTHEGDVSTLIFSPRRRVD